MAHWRIYTYLFLFSYEYIFRSRRRRATIMMWDVTASQLRVGAVNAHVKRKIVKRKLTNWHTVAAASICSVLFSISMWIALVFPSAKWLLIRHFRQLKLTWKLPRGPGHLIEFIEKFNFRFYLAPLHKIKDHAQANTEHVVQTRRTCWLLAPRMKAKLTQWKCSQVLSQCGERREKKERIGSYKQTLSELHCVCALCTKWYRVGVAPRRMPTDYLPLAAAAAAQAHPNIRRHKRRRYKYCIQ